MFILSFKRIDISGSCCFFARYCKKVYIIVQYYERLLVYYITINRKVMNIRLLLKRLCSSVISKWAVLLLDILIVGVSIFATYSWRYSLDQMASIPETGKVIAAAMIVNTLFFLLVRTYIGILRYSSFIDLTRIVISLTLSYGVSAVILSGYVYAGHHLEFSLGMLGLAYVINMILMSSSRIVTKLFYELAVFDRKQRTNVFIYGTKDENANMAQSIRMNQLRKYHVKGFLTDDAELVGKEVMGARIYKNDAHIYDTLLLKDVKYLIVSPSKLKAINESDMIDKLSDCNIEMLSVPQLNEWGNTRVGNGSMKLRQIQIEDLLGRMPIEIDIHKIASHIEGKRILVTGAAGSIGSEIVRQVATLNPYMVILVDQAETPLHLVRLELQARWRNLQFVTLVADVTNLARMERIFREYTPQYVFHAAAYKHVPMMEDNVSESIQANVMGTKNMADLAVKYRVEKFVMISTDKAVNPTNVMGCSKRIAEIYVQALAEKLKREGDRSVKFITTRFGNVLGSNGSVIPRFKEQIEKGGPVTVTHPEIIRYFMTIPEACRLVLEAGSMGNGGEIYIFDMGEPVKILDLAKRMIHLSGQKQIEIQFTGLRPGEKLYEELLNIKEQTQATVHEKIMIAKVRRYDFDEVKARIQHLIKISYGYDPMQIVAVMKEIVPEYISRNSEFEVLDKRDSEILDKVV